MKKSDQLKQERTAKVEAQQAIVDAAKAENRDVAAFNEDEVTRFDNLTAEISALDTTIARQLQVEANETRTATRTAAPVTTTVEDGEGKEKRALYSKVSLFKAIRQAGNSRLDGAEKELHEIGQKEQRDADIKNADLDGYNLSIPIDYLGRASEQTVTQDSGNYGGKLVQDQTAKFVDSLMAETTVLEELGATYWTGLTGGDLPINSGSEFEMAFMGEVDEITIQKQQFTQKKLSPNRLGGAVDLNNRLLMQTSFSVEAYISSQLVRGYNKALTQAALQGDGTYVTGLETYSGVNVASDAAAVVPTWSKIVSLKSSVYAADSTRDKLAYLVHPTLEGLLETISKDSGSGQFILQNGKIGMMNYKATSLLNTGWDEVDTYPTFFGDWSQMFIGQWGAINVKVNPFSADLKNAIRLVLNTHADMEIANPAAFSRNLFFAETAGS